MSIAFWASAGYAQCIEGKIRLYESECYCTGDGITAAECNYENGQYGCNEDGHILTCNGGCDRMDAGECEPAGRVAPSAMLKKMMLDPDIIRSVAAKRSSTACDADEEVFERWFKERFPQVALPKTDTGGI